jgi:AraC family transcriptional regulator
LRRRALSVRNCVGTLLQLRAGNTAGWAQMNATRRDVADPYADPYFAERDRLDAYEHLGVRQLGKGELVAARFRRVEPGLGMTLPNVRSDVCMAIVNLQPLNGDDIWCDGRHGRRASMPRGGFAILDHRHSWTTVQNEPFETVQVFMPLASLNELTDELRAPAIETLVCPIYSVQRDKIMLHLALSLLPALSRPKEVSGLFADHVFAAMRMHLAQTYGGLRPPPEKARGGLAPWQERRVKDLLLHDLHADRSLSDLANACGMSARHLVRAFKATTGLPPHRWLMRRRVERAKELLEFTDESLSEIALSCGFADQSHLTRVFQALAGSGPGAWRRQRRT